MNTQEGKEIISHVVRETEWRWQEYDISWNDIDRMLIARGYEQGGFSSFHFVPLLEEEGIYSIHDLGGILKDHVRALKYERDYAGSLEAEFYRDLQGGIFGEEGKAFCRCVKEFLEKKLGNPGGFFWRTLWQMLTCCRQLRVYYEGSFSHYLKRKYADFKRLSHVSDSDFLSMSTGEWESFKQTKKPWKELYGIGENTFDFVVGDMAEADFVSNSYKLDSSNEYFLKVTGLSKVVGSLGRDRIMHFLNALDLSYTLREINKGIYTYCSETEKENFGFCRDRGKCGECGINNICEKNLI
jgi:hypothetical protein